jgi:hypothetical protein
MTDEILNGLLSEQLEHVKQTFIEKYLINIIEKKMIFLWTKFQFTNV